MKSIHGLYSMLCSSDYLEKVAAATTRGKRRRQDVAWFLFRQEERLAAIREALASGSWQPGGFEVVYLRDPKPRAIARAPIEDRIVHAALAIAMLPAIENSLRPEAFACRPGLGTHRALLHLLREVRRHRFVLHLDIRSYFPTIRLDILRELLIRKIRDRAFLALLDRVLNSGQRLYRDPRLRHFVGLPAEDGFPRGLPIGAYTSQILASHLYLTALDHRITRQPGGMGYLRYVDDIFVFGNERAGLRRWREDIGLWLWQERGLRLKHPEAPVLSCHGEIHALGHRVGREGLRPLPRLLRRMTRKLRGELRLCRPRRSFRRRMLASVCGLVLWPYG